MDEELEVIIPNQPEHKYNRTVIKDFAQNIIYINLVKTKFQILAYSIF